MADIRYSYTWKDKGWRNIVSGVSKLGSSRVQAGVVGSAAAQVHDDSGLTVGDIAILNEFGSGDGHTPERSFIRSTLFKLKREMASVSARAARRVIFNGVSASTALGDIGEWASQRIKDTIIAGPPPPNRPATVHKKGHGNTLIELGLLLHAVGYQVISAAAAALAAVSGDEGGG
jgi:hypothetical protein